MSTFASTEAQNNHTEYSIQTQYWARNGVLQLPVAAKPTAAARVPSVVVRTSAPYGRKVVTWSATRVGAMPVLPDPTAPDSNHVLDETLIAPATTTLSPDGVTHTYHVSGSYSYILRIPLTAGDTLLIGNPPYEATNPQPNAVTRQNFSRLVLGPTTLPLQTPLGT